MTVEELRDAIVELELLRVEQARMRYRLKDGTRCTAALTRIGEINARRQELIRITGCTDLLAKAERALIGGRRAFKFHIVVTNEATPDGVCRS